MQQAAQRISDFFALPAPKPPQPPHPQEFIDNCNKLPLWLLIVAAVAHINRHGNNWLLNKIIPYYLKG